MSVVDDLVQAYIGQVTLLWRQGLSGAERAWLLVYPPGHERRMRRRLPELAQATRDAGHGWVELDLTDSFGRWLMDHDYASAFVADPDQLTAALLEDYESYVVDLVRERLMADEADSEAVVALVGIGSLFPFLRASRLMQAVDGAIRGRLLVLFPGTHERASSNYRLLDAHDGFNYRALPIEPLRAAHKFYERAT